MLQLESLRGSVSSSALVWMWARRSGLAWVPLLKLVLALGSALLLMPVCATALVLVLV